MKPLHPLRLVEPNNNILLPPTFVKYMEFLLKPSSNGLAKEFLHVFKCPEEKDSIPSLKLKNSSQPPNSLEAVQENMIKKKKRVRDSPNELGSVMPESLPNIRNPISNDKLMISNENIPTMKSSQKSAQGSIIKDRSSLPYWNEFTKGMSNKLWFGTATEWQGLDSSLWNGCSNKAIVNSWFTVKRSLEGMVMKNMQTNASNIELRNLPTTLWPSLMSSWPEIMAKELLKKKEKENNGLINPKKTKKLTKKTDLMDPNHQNPPPNKKIKFGNKNPIQHTKKEETEINEEKKVKTKNEKLPSNRVMKIRVYPTTLQKQTLNKWFGVYRWTYNQFVALTRSPSFNAVYWLTKKHLRTYALNQECVLVKQNPSLHWIFQCPYDVRDGAVSEFITALQTNLKKRKHNPQFKFKLQFKSKRKQRNQYIPILSKHYRDQGIIFPQFFGKQPLPSRSEKLPETLVYDSKLIRDYTGKYSLCIPQPPKKFPIIHRMKSAQRNITKERDIRIVSIDPGVRTFATLYDPGNRDTGFKGQYIEFGNGDMGRIMRLGYHMDRLQSKMDKMKQTKPKALRMSCKIKTRRVRNMTLAYRRMQTKIRNLIQDFHCKCSKWLCENYNYILLPKFETKQMASKKRIEKEQKNLDLDMGNKWKRKVRLITSTTVRQMLTWSHYKFQQRLIHKASMYPDCEVEIISEAYTTQCCPKCGTCNKKVGGSKMFICSNDQCDYRCARDPHGSRNIWLRWITESHNDLSN